MFLQKSLFEYFTHLDIVLVCAETSTGVKNFYRIWINNKKMGMLSYIRGVWGIWGSTSLFHNVLIIIRQ